MADNAPIVVNDGESTPVAHTYSPVRIRSDNGKAIYENRAETYALGRESLEVGMTASSKVRTTDIVLKVPKVVVETINGVAVPKVADYGTFKATCIVPLTWDAQDCENLRVLGANILAHATLVAMNDNGEFVW